MSDTPDFDLIVLSPHLDDGVLSCGGQLVQAAQRGERALVATFFTADLNEPDLSPFAKRVIHNMNLDPATAMAARRAEDADACQLLGVDLHHAGIDDAIARASSEGNKPYQSTQSLFAAPDASDAGAVHKRLALHLAELPTARRWLIPLAIGNHVDHQLLRAGAERFLAQHARPPVLTGYYEDLPYGFSRNQRWRSLGFPMFRPWRAKLFPCSNTDVETKINAIKAYSSQVRPLFGGDHELARAVRRYTKKVGGERVWQPRDR